MNGSRHSELSIESEFHARCKRCQTRNEGRPSFITDRGLSAFALLKIEDDLLRAGRTEASLLDVMDTIPCGDGIKFEPAQLQAVFQSA